MATGKPKVKRMMLGGAALGGVKKSVAANAAPMRTQSQMQNAVKQDMNSKAAQFQRAGTTFGKPGGSQTAKTGLGQAMNNAAKQDLNSKAAQFQRAAPKQMQFMSDKLRAAQAAQQQAMKGGAKFAPDSGYVQQLKQMTPDQRQRTMAINAAKNAAETQRVNQFNAMTPEQRIRAEGMKKGLASLGKKKGGAVKKATKK